MTEMYKAALFLHVKIDHSCPMNMQKTKFRKKKIGYNY